MINPMYIQIGNDRDELQQIFCDRSSHFNLIKKEKKLFNNVPVVGICSIKLFNRQ